MITGIWVHPDSFEEEDEDCVIIEYQDAAGAQWRYLIDGNGDTLPMEGEAPDVWTRVFPATGLTQTVQGPVAGSVTQAGTIHGGVHLRR